ncbi:MAG: ABC transporter permease [Deltaproteobacteria bacterium]
MSHGGTTRAPGADPPARNAHGFGQAWLALEPLALPVLGVAIAFGLCGVAIAAIGRSPLLAAVALFDGGLGGLGPLGESALKATALTFTGLAVAVPYAAGLFNIGAQGQFLAGALAAAVVGSSLDLPAPLEIGAALLGAFAAGAALGALAGWLKASRGVHEVLSTILLNWIAIHLINSWLVVGPLHASGASGFSHGGTEAVRLQAHLPLLAGSLSRLNLGLLFAAVAVGGCAYLLRRTRFGLELRALGASEQAARTVGVPVGRRTLEALALGGGLAGLGGALLLLGGGTDYRFPENYRDPYGFDGIAIALIGAGNPLGVGLAAALFGTLRAGAIRLQDPDVGLHRSWPEIAQGLAVILIAGQRLLASLYRLPLRWRLGPHSEADARPPLPSPPT